MPQVTVPPSWAVEVEVPGATGAATRDRILDELVGCLYPSLSVCVYGYSYINTH